MTNNLPEVAAALRGRPAFPGKFLIAVACIVLAVVGTGIYVVRGILRGASTIADVFRPQINVTETTHTAVTAMHTRLKLIVEEADISAEASRAESYSWWGIYFGTTTARIRAKGCHVQYVIPLEDFGTSDIESAITPEGKRVLRVILPEPEVNENIVEIPYNNLEVESASGWARFNKSEVAEEAKALLRPAAIAEGKLDWHIKAVKVDAEPEVRRILEPLINSLQPDVKFEVVFRPKN